MKDTRIVICSTIAELPRPNVMSYLRHCQSCDVGLWLAHSSILTAGEDELVPVCGPCGAKMMRDLGIDKIEPPGAAQIADIQRWRGRKESS